MRQRSGPPDEEIADDDANAAKDHAIDDITTPCDSPDASFQLEEEAGGGVNCCIYWAGDKTGCQNCAKKQGQDASCC